MTFYTTLDGSVLDLRVLTEDEREHLARCASAYQADMEWAVFHELAAGRGNPHINASGGAITRTIWDHPLFRATRDLEDRLGIRQGKLRPHPGDDVDRSPFQQTEAGTDDAISGPHHGSKFEVYKDARGEWRWRLKSSTGETIATGGEGYTSKMSCLRGIESIRRTVPIAEIEAPLAS